MPEHLLDVRRMPGMDDYGDADYAASLTAGQTWEIRQLGRWPVPKCHRVLKALWQIDKGHTPAARHLAKLIEGRPACTPWPMFAGAPDPIPEIAAPHIRPLMSRWLRPSPAKIRQDNEMAARAASRRSPLLSQVTDSAAMTREPEARRCFHWPGWPDEILASAALAGSPLAIAEMLGWPAEYPQQARP